MYRTCRRSYEALVGPFWVTIRQAPKRSKPGRAGKRPTPLSPFTLINYSINTSWHCENRIRPSALLKCSDTYCYRTPSSRTLESLLVLTQMEICECVPFWGRNRLTQHSFSRRSYSTKVPLSHQDCTGTVQRFARLASERRYAGLHPSTWSPDLCE